MNVQRFYQLKLVMDFSVPIVYLEEDVKYCRGGVAIRWLRLSCFHY